MPRRLLLILRILLSLLILGLLLRMIDFRSLAQIQWNPDPVLLTSMALLLFVSLASRAIRWMLLVNQDEKHVSFAESFRFMLVGLALNIVMPAGAGEVVKGYFAYKVTGIKEKMLAISLSDKLMGIAALFPLSIYAFARTMRPEFLLAGLLSLLPISALLILHHLSATARMPAFLEGWFDRVKRMDVRQLIAEFHIRPSLLLTTLLLSVSSWMFTYALLKSCFLLVGSGIEYTSVLIESPLVTLARLFPLTFNGIGSDEAVIVFLLKKYGPAESFILAAALVYRLILMIVPAVPGLFYLSSIQLKGNEQS